MARDLDPLFFIYYSEKKSPDQIFVLQTKDKFTFAWYYFCNVFLVSLEKLAAACFQSIFLQKW